MSPPADGWEYTDPVFILKHPLFSFVMVVDHGQEANGRVNRQNIAEFSNGSSFRDLKMEFALPEIWEIGIIAF